MAKRKVDVCDNVNDLEHKKFRIDEGDKNDVSVAVCDTLTHEKLDDVIDALGGSSTSTCNSINEFNEINSVVKDNLSTIHSYTVNSTGVVYLQNIFVSGCNISEYTVYINGNIIDKKLTYFSSSLNEEFNFTDTKNFGYKLSNTDVIEVKVTHKRPKSSSYNARLQFIEVI